jgi:pimeloyl-ACP methyl ester carboxylesterase
LASDGDFGFPLCVIGYEQQHIRRRGILNTITASYEMKSHRDIRRRGCLFYVKRSLKWLGIGLVTLVIFGIVYQTIATEVDKRTYSPRGQLYTVNGHQMHLYCVGEGSPTVVLEAGGYAESLWWYRIQNQLADHTQVCAYDRPGLGYSEPTTLSRDPVTIIGELHTLLGEAGINPPYVLTGHSFGAILVRVFADQYPEDVSGLVLVDSASPRPAHFNSEAEFAEWKSCHDVFQAFLGILSRIGFWRLTVGNDFSAWGYPSEIVPELVALRSNDQAFLTYYAEAFPVRHALNEASAAARDLGDLPLAIMWADHSFSSGADEAVIEGIKQEVAGYSTNSVTRIVEGSEHGSILGTEPYARQVSDAILDVIEAAQTGNPLAQ